MGLNNIELTPSSLVALFGTVLIESEAGEINSFTPAPKTESKAPEINEPALKHLGNNQKQILIVVNYSDCPILPDPALSLLTNMLNACKLSLADVAIINFHNYRTNSSKEILAKFKSRQILLFGIEPADFGLPVNFPLFQIQALAGATFLYSNSLDEIATDKLAKSKLWVSLQHIFKV